MPCPKAKKKKRNRLNKCLTQIGRGRHYLLLVRHSVTRLIVSINHWKCQNDSHGGGGSQPERKHTKTKDLILPNSPSFNGLMRRFHYSSSGRIITDRLGASEETWGDWRSLSSKESRSQVGRDKRKTNKTIMTRLFPPFSLATMARLFLMTPVEGGCRASIIVWAKPSRDFLRLGVVTSSQGLFWIYFPLLLILRGKDYFLFPLIPFFSLSFSLPPRGGLKPGVALVY